MKKLSRRSFGKALSVGAVGLSLAAPSVARAAISRPNSRPFADFNFGDFPKSELVCVKGACIDPDFQCNYSKYKMPIDINFFGGVEISAPTYGYYDDELLRISFGILHAGDGFNRDLTAVLSALDDQYRIALVNKTRAVNSEDHETWIDKYVTSQGHVINIVRKKRRGSWGKAYIQIYDKYLMDGACMDVNPNFVPK